MLRKLVTKSFTAIIIGLVIVGSLQFSQVIGNIGSLGFNSAYAEEIVNPTLTPEREAELRTQLAEVEKEIKDQQAILNQKQGEGVSITRDIAILDVKIKQALLKIKAHNIAIERLGKDITIKTKTIKTLEQRIDANKISLSEILNQTHQLENYTLPEVLLAKQSVSDFFIDVDSFAFARASLKDVFDSINSTKNETETQKQQLNDKRNDEIDAKVDVEKEQASIKKNETEKQRLLSLNKQQQKDYQRVIADKQKVATQIRNALFQLRDADSIKFGDALQYAKSASISTGVRPAFLLAILMQESALGKNVGRCYMTDQVTGAGVYVSTGAAVANVMKPSRDVQPFLAITSQVGRNPSTTRVSCPFQVGYGGAMGPAQFIPSTWQLFASRVEAANGKGIADPWNPQDAFTAASLYLGDLGASSQSYSAERNAACKYYSGSSCKGSTQFYGDQVLAKATSIQADIDTLSGS